MSIRRQCELLGLNRSTLYYRGVGESEENLKLMRREVLEQLDLTQPGFAINAETGLQPLLLGYSVLLKVRLIERDRARRWSIPAATRPVAPAASTG